jgi:hypothetical protein
VVTEPEAVSPYIYWVVAAFGLAAVMLGLDPPTTPGMWAAKLVAIAMMSVPGGVVVLIAWSMLSGIGEAGWASVRQGRWLAAVGAFLLALFVIYLFADMIIGGPRPDEGRYGRYP